MRTYESIFIVHPEVVGDDQTEIIEKFKTVLTDQGAEILNVDIWGTRTLAYIVKKQTKGCFVLVVFDAEPAVITEFERRMRIDEKVIKFQTVVLEGGYEAPPVVEVAPEEATAEATEAAVEAPAEAVKAAVEAPAEAVKEAVEATEVPAEEPVAEEKTEEA